MHQCHHLFCNFFAGINFGWPMGNHGTSSITTFPLMSSTFFLFWWLVQLMRWHKMTVVLLFWQRAIKAFLWHIEQVYGVFNLILLILTFKSAIQVKNTELCLKQALIQLWLLGDDVRTISKNVHSQLRSRQLLHTTFKIFWTSVLLQVRVYLSLYPFISYPVNLSIN